MDDPEASKASGLGWAGIRQGDPITEARLTALRDARAAITLELDENDVACRAIDALIEQASK